MCSLRKVFACERPEEVRKPQMGRKALQHSYTLTLIGQLERLQPEETASFLKDGGRPMAIFVKTF